MEDLLVALGERARNSNVATDGSYQGAAPDEPSSEPNGDSSAPGQQGNGLPSVDQLEEGLSSLLHFPFVSTQA